MEEFLRYWMRWPSVEHLIYKYLWVWGVGQSLHFVGMVLLIGTVGILDLRILGMAKQFPVAAIKSIRTAIAPAPADRARRGNRINSGATSSIANKTRQDDF